jgi:large subunit ribosomal protein L29
MKPEEIRDKSVDELHAQVEELNETIFNLQFQHATGQLENPMRMKVVKKDIARVMTIIREKELAEAEE